MQLRDNRGRAVGPSRSAILGKMLHIFHKSDKKASPSQETGKVVAVFLLWSSLTKAMTSACWSLTKTHPN